MRPRWPLRGADDPAVSACLTAYRDGCAVLGDETKLEFWISIGVFARRREVQHDLLDFQGIDVRREVVPRWSRISPPSDPPV